MAIKSDVSADGKVLTIKVVGRFDITAYRDFGAAYKDNLDTVSEWIIDMSGVEYMDSSALGMLLMLRERAGGDNAQIKISDCNPSVEKIIKTANFDKLFTIE